MDDEPLYNLETEEDNGFFSRFIGSKIGKIASVMTVTIGITLGYTGEMDFPENFDEIKQYLTGENLIERTVGDVQPFQKSIDDFEHENVNVSPNSISDIHYETTREVESEILRKEYIESQINRVEKISFVETPENLEGYIYKNNDYPNSIMRVKYFPNKPEDKGKVDVDALLKITPNSFELNNQDDFVSALIHEYNHIRALNREEILDENKYYLEGNSDLKWRDLYREDMYDHDFNNLYREVRNNIREPVFEIIATEEQRYLHDKYLMASDALDQHIENYQRRHIGQLRNSLQRYDADEELVEEIEKIIPDN